MKLKYYLRGLGIGMVVTALLMGFATKDNNQMSDEEVKARAMELGMVEQRTLADIRDNAEPTQTPDIIDIPATNPGTEAVTPTEVLDGSHLQGNDVPNTTDTPQVTDEPENIETPQASDAPQITDMPQITEEPEYTKVPLETEAPEASEAPQETDVPNTTIPDGTENLEASEAPVNDPSEAVEETPVPLPIAEISGDMVKVTIYEGNNSMNVCRVLEEAGLIEDALTFDRYLRKYGYSKIINTGSHKITLGTSEEDVAKIITNTD